LIYIIGSGFSGLTTAYALLKKNKDITIITPTKIVQKNKNFAIFKYILNKSGEIKNSPKEIEDTINFIEKISYAFNRSITRTYNKILFAFI
jgi:aspartate oxidase